MADDSNAVAERLYLHQHLVQCECETNSIISQSVMLMLLLGGLTLTTLVIYDVNSAA